MAILGIIGTVEASKHVSPQVSGIITVILALVLGALAGFLGLDGLTPTAGLLMGVSAVAIDTTAKTLSGK